MRSTPNHGSCRLLLKASIMIFYCMLSMSSIAQKDSLILNNGNIIVGEVKSMDKGVVIMETGYSKNDFTIEWSGIKEIYSKSRFLVTLTSGQRINGAVESQPGTNKILITDEGGQKTETTIPEIVYLKGVKSNFWSRVNASISIGLNLTKANNLHQFSSRTNLGYLADKWQFVFFYDDLRSKQEGVERTRRTELGPSFKYFLAKDWFLTAILDFLSNTEQAIKLRTTAKVGAGRFVVHTNKAYFGLGGGLSYNNENFDNGTPSRSSLEGYVGMEANLFDVKDLSLLSSLYVYPSITESGRWRTDFSLDIKYDLPYNFYIRLGGTLNFDNRPAVEGNDVDYVTDLTIGWEL